MAFRMILAGVGGQGILFSTRLLAEAAMRDGMGVIGSETHGMSQRGGSVISHLKAGGYSSPLVRAGTADALISFQVDEAYRNLKFLRPTAGSRDGGALYVNAPAGFPVKPVADLLSASGIAWSTVDASSAALRLGSPLVSNLVVLGFAADGPSFPISLEQLFAAVEAISPARFRDLNLEALREGRRLHHEPE